MGNPLRMGVLCLALAACGDDDGGTNPPDAATADTAGTPDSTPRPDAPTPCQEQGGSVCFELPSGPVMVEVATVPEAADLDCTPPAPTMSSGSIDLTGQARDYVSLAGLEGATIEFFYDGDVSGTADATTTSGAAGAVSVTLPSPVPSQFHFCLTSASSIRTCGSTTINTALSSVSGYFFDAISRDTEGATLILVGEEKDASTAYVFGQVVDCQGRGLLHAIGTISSTSSVGDVAPTFVPGVPVFYFSGGSVPLPVPRTESTETEDNGLFVVTGVPTASRYYVQAWGFPDTTAAGMGMAGLRLLSERSVLGVEADSLIGVGGRITEGPF